MANVKVFAGKRMGQKLLVYARDLSMRGHKKGESHTVRQSEKNLNAIQSDSLYWYLDSREK